MASTLKTYQQLRTSFQHQNFKPLYFFYGEEQYLIGELQDLLIEKAVPPEQRDFNFDLIYGSEVTAEEVLGICRSYPVMAEHRLVIVREFQELEGNRKFKEYAENPVPTSIVLVVCADKPNLSHHPYRALKNNGVNAHFRPLYDRQVPGWIQQRLESRGLTVDPAAVQMLAESAGQDLYRAASEIEKLAAYAGDDGRVTRDAVLAVGGYEREYNVFELQEAIGEGEYVRAVEIANRMLQHAGNVRGESLMIVAVLTKYFIKLWKLLDCQGEGLSKKGMASRIGVPKYYLDDYLASLKRFDYAAIDRAFRALLAADFELKGGSNRGPRVVLELMLGRMLDRLPS